MTDGCDGGGGRRCCDSLGRRLRRAGGAADSRPGGAKQRPERGLRGHWGGGRNSRAGGEQPRRGGAREAGRASCTVGQKVRRSFFADVMNPGRRQKPPAPTPAPGALPSLFLFLLHFHPNMADPSSASLGDLLAEALPQGAKFTFYHISTPPTKCGAIFSAPPGARSERTYCESHFLNVSITPDDEQQQRDHKAPGEVLVFAIEVLIYTTSHLTTIFVSKADSTGYLSLLKLPRTTSSPIRAISTTFVSWLVKHRQRPATRLVVSLFARAQDQYLFPGSIENTSKHVADDTALVKWWCKVLDPVLRAYTPEASGKPHSDPVAQTTAQGHLIIPGFERNDTMRFFPPSVRADPPEQKRWKHGHPLLDISRHPSAPPRCLIPHFPDDPKSRYMDELDDELPDGGNSSVTSPSRGTGQWRSVRSLEQFWEMMSFRQECSSGRLVGFIWVVFTPTDVDTTSDASDDADAAALGPSGQSQAITNSLAEMLAQPPTTPPKKDKKSSSRNSSRTPRRRSSKLTGPIIPRLPRIKSSSSQTSNPDNTAATSASSTAAPSSSSVPESSRYYVWPAHSRGTLVVDEKDYKRATDLLLHHNFAERVIATVSTRRWIEEVAVLGSRGGTTGWGVVVVGRNAAATATISAAAAEHGSGVGNNGAQTINTLNTSMVRKKRKGGGTDADAVQQQQQQQPSPDDKAAAAGGGVNVLSAGLVRKKPKTDGDGIVSPAVENVGPAEAAAPVAESVNVLSSNLVRKKPKA